MMTNPNSTTTPTFVTTDYPEPTVTRFNSRYVEVQLGHVSALARPTPAAVASAIVDLQTRYESEVE